MTKLTFCDTLLAGSEVKESPLPGLVSAYDDDPIPTADPAVIGELLVGYGYHPPFFPYRCQDRYDRELTERRFPTAVLENDFLRAVFALTLGGRMLSLYDKVRGRELLFRNPVFRPAHLAVRNAWFSGGTEWNCGVRGHTPLTCSPMFAARLAGTDGTPVLRLYQYERMRGFVYQLDFTLPADSPLLYVTTRVVNTRDTTVPMYWWSNTAVAATGRDRVVVPADHAYTCDERARVIRVDIPYRDGMDVSYPADQTHSNDHFWQIPVGCRRYMAAYDGEGNGLIQTATDRLRGRKLFAWGNTAGGRHWQSFLSGGGSDGAYYEIQAGLAPTQYECLPMPAGAVWDWMEVYGGVTADPEKIHGSWASARAETERVLETLITRETLERRFEENRAILTRPAEQTVQFGDPWPALENERRRAAGLMSMTPHLDFGTVGGVCEPWQTLLKTGSFGQRDPQNAPVSWRPDERWQPMLDAALTGADRENWYAWLQAGCGLFADGQYGRAREALMRSVSLAPSYAALYALAECARKQRDPDACRTAAIRLFGYPVSGKEAASVLIAACGLLYRLGDHEELYRQIRDLPPSYRDLPRIRLYHAFAAFGTGHVGEAEAELMRDGGLIVPDMREGELSLSELWLDIRAAQAAREGRTFDRDTEPIPEAFDFRMYTAD